MKSLARQMSVYYQYHKKQSTRLTHFVGIPLVLFSVLVFLGWFNLSVPNLFSLSLAWIALFVVGVYYLLLDWQIGGAMVVTLILLNLVAHFFSHRGPTLFSVELFIITFALGWLFQLIGHIFEGRRPALVDNLFQAVVGPIFIMAEVFFLCGHKKDLQAEVKALAGDDQP